MKNVGRNYGFIKGRIAEALIERLFITLNFEVYPYGIEKKLPPRLLRIHRKSGNKMQLFARSENDPDYIVIRTKDGEEKTRALEVKFRTDGKIRLKELDKYASDEILFILLDRAHIYCLESADRKKFCKRKDKRGKSEHSEEIVFSQCMKLYQHSGFCFTREERKIIRGFSTLIAGTLGQCAGEREIELVLGDMAKQASCCDEFNALASGDAILKRKLSTYR